MGGGRGVTGLGSAGVCREALHVNHTGIGNSRGCPKSLRAVGWLMAPGPLQVTASHKKWVTLVMWEAGLELLELSHA